MIGLMRKIACCTLDCLFVRNVWLTAPFAIVLGFVAPNDALNNHTVTIYNWRALTLFMLVMTTLSAASWIFRWALFGGYTLAEYQGALKQEKQTESQPLTKREKSSINTVPPAVSTQQWQRNREVTRAMLMYAIPMVALYIYIAWQACFIYDYAQDSTGYSALLDDGFSRSNPATFVFNRKLVMLDWIQHAAVWAATMGTLVAVTCRQNPVTEFKNSVHKWGDV